MLRVIMSIVLHHMRLIIMHSCFAPQRHRGMLHLLFLLSKMLHMLTHMHNVESQCRRGQRVSQPHGRHGRLACLQRLYRDGLCNAHHDKLKPLARTDACRTGEWCASNAARLQTLTQDCAGLL
jgi:hypothetical protein